MLENIITFANKELDVEAIEHWFVPIENETVDDCREVSVLQLIQTKEEEEAALRMNLIFPSS